MHGKQPTPADTVFRPNAEVGWTWILWSAQGMRMCNRANAVWKLKCLDANFEGANGCMPITACKTVCLMSSCTRHKDTAELQQVMLVLTV